MDRLNWLKKGLVIVLAIFCFVGLGNANSPDTDLNSKIQAALLKSNAMGDDISAWSVKFEAHGGEVTLTGEVLTQQQRNTIVDTVKSVSGVSKVIDNTVIAGSTADVDS